MKVLICDDTEMIRRTLKMFLEKSGHEVVAEAAGGEEAVVKYMETSPDVCLLDISMPEVDGIQTLKKLKDVDPNVKVIMITGLEDQILMLDAVQAGAIDFIKKPFTAERLTISLSKIQPA